MQVMLDVNERLVGMKMIANVSYYTLFLIRFYSVLLVLSSHLEVKNEIMAKNDHNRILVTP